MQTNTTVRDPDSRSTSGDPYRPKPGAKTLIAGVLAVVTVVALVVVTSDLHGAKSTSSDVTPASVETRGPTTPAAPFSDDFALCHLGIEGIELTYPRPLVAQAVARYAAACPPDRGGEVIPAPSD